MHVHSNTYGILYTLCEVLNEVPTVFGVIVRVRVVFRKTVVGD